jgi:mannose-6-phosphate isomerase-like protein (cupin superfamily)
MNAIRVIFVGLFAFGVAFAVYAASQEPPRVPTFFPAAQVNAAFAKGGPLLETNSYKILAARREAPGQAEVHAKDADVFYVVEGSATIVTGGEVVDGKTTAVDEVRGASIRGGTTQKLSKGDVLVIPKGVPHQFTEASAPFLYFVVKSTSN